MRTVATIPHPHIKITIHQYNDKYLIEMEAAQYKQTYKISVDSVDGVEGIKLLCSPEFIQKCMQRFQGMHEEFGQAFAAMKK
jgi:hypothetical protein